MTKITQLKLENFTAFKALDLDFNPGVNVIIGSNGTGKTHLLKILYAACSITDGTDREKTFAQKLLNVFNPFESRIGRLAHRGSVSINANIEVIRDAHSKITATFSNHTKDASGVKLSHELAWKKVMCSSAYIPVKEMLAHAPGFIATIARRELAFEEVYSDIIERALLPKLKGPVDEKRKKVLSALQTAIDGKVSTKGENFFLKNRQGELEFTLLSEGIRKLALIWLLTQNGVLTNGSILFWDEPEANLNPGKMGEVVETILELARIGVQVFLSTHNYVLLKEFDLRRKDIDQLVYISLFRNENADIEKETAMSIMEITHNRIAETYDSIYNREISRSVGDIKI